MKKKKNNSKRRTITGLSIIWGVIIVLLVFSLVSIPNFGKNGINAYTAPLGKIGLGTDLSGGFYAIVEANTTEENEETGNKEDVADFAEKLNEAITVMQKRLRNYNASDASVTKAGATAIRVELPTSNEAETVLAAISKPTVFEICYPNTRDTSKAGDVIITNSNLSKIKTKTTSEGSVGVEIRLDEAGRTAYSTATYWAVDKSQTLKVWIDGVEHSEITVSERVTDGIILLTSGIANDEAAYELAMQLDSGAIQLTFKDPVIYAVGSKLGENPLTAVLIAGGISLVLMIGVMFLLYSRFGIAASLSLLIYTLLFVILLSTLPWVRLTLAGIVGIIVSFALMLDANIGIFERIKNEYSSGKSIVASCDAGFKKSLWTIIDSHVIVLLACAAFWALGSVFINSFAITLFIGTILSVLCSLVFTRFTVYRLLAINSTSPKIYKLTREVEEEHE